MESKIEKIEKFIISERLTLEELSAYCALMQKQREEEEARQKVAELFPADDVRSKALLYDYVFEGGKFSTDPNAYPNCQGVVGWINSNPNAQEGDKIYVVLPKQTSLVYCASGCETGADDLYDGRANTLKLIKFGKKHGIKFYAAEYACNYTENGIKQCEAFLPAREQLVRLCENRERLRETLKKIGGDFDGFLISSSEYDSVHSWYVNSNNGEVERFYKFFWESKVSCILAY